MNAVIAIYPPTVTVENKGIGHLVVDDDGVLRVIFPVQEPIRPKQ